MGEIIPFPVWINPFPVLIINFENFRSNKKYVVKEFLGAKAPLGLAHVKENKNNNRTKKFQNS